MKRPLVWFAILLCLGIFAARLVRMQFWYCYVLTFGSCIALIFIRKKVQSFGIFLFLFAFFLGATLFKNSNILPRCHIAHFIYYRNPVLPVVRGFVAGEPSVEENRTTFVFHASEIQYANSRFTCCGKIIVRLKGRGEFRYQDELLLKGYLYRPYKGAGSAGRGYREYLAGQGIYALMNIRGVNFAQILKRKKSLTFRGLALGLKEKIEKIIFRYFNGAVAGILDAMLLGEKKNIPAPIYNSMMKTGTVHILVVSGFNVGIVIFVLFLALKLIRLSRRLRIYSALPFLLLYCLATGASNPVVRSTVMGVAFILSYLAKREPDTCVSLSLAAIVILLVNPNQLFDIGFQLSFSSVAALVYFYPRFRAPLKIDSLKINPLRFLIEGFLVSFSAWLGTMGIIAYYFGTFSPVTVLANLVIVPLATLITLCGFSLVFVSLTCPFLAGFFAAAVEFFVILLVKANFLFLQIPHAYFYWD